ncbi:hypothetical protein [Metabacillus fastidiosus]|uniref:hypothetical protein n=1 Tax=Metabacillus fastidiosus TaxID=1458 RepID=UPI002DBE9546|nr:hypothetical protein [Metabacillus fastidiosus]MEC2078414.1 hypothetical protein [Metabacillus fastidiosus]
MFLEKHESAAVEEFTWFDENGECVDSEEPLIKIQLSSINRYIVEVSQGNQIIIPPFIYWLFENNYQVYCIDDCTDAVTEMTTVQKILFERRKVKENWVSLVENKYIYQKKFTHANEVELIWDKIFFFSKNNLDSISLLNLYESFRMKDSSFPNLSFPKILPKFKDLIIGKVTWGTSYFKRGTNEEPVVLICYTAQKL